MNETEGTTKPHFVVNDLTNIIRTDMDSPKIVVIFNFLFHPLVSEKVRREIVCVGCVKEVGRELSESDLLSLSGFETFEQFISLTYPHCALSTALELTRCAIVIFEDNKTSGQENLLDFV